MEILNLTAKQLRQAADLQEKIQSLQAELTRLLGGGVPQPRAVAPQPARKRKISAAGRAAISAAAKARWAKVRAAAPAQAAAKPKKQMSDAARARLSALAKARWRKAKAAGKKAL